MRQLLSISALIFYILIGFLQPSPLIAANKLTGKDIKQQSIVFFAKEGIEAQILVSDKRSFFPCTSDLKFYPRTKNDWRTISIQCETEAWRVSLRTNSVKPKINLQPDDPNIADFNYVVSLQKNISKGQVLAKSHLKITKVLKNQAFGSFDDLKDVLGKKVTANLSKGSIIKPRHLNISYDVEKNDTVLVTIGNKNLNISTFGLALESGQVGDMISIRNIKSNKVFKVIIYGEKKVTPLANM